MADTSIIQRSTTRVDRRYYGLLNQLRGVAAVLVVWSHIVGYKLPSEGHTWLGFTLFNRFITGPLNIVQNFGWFGVVLFFLISGFVITDAAYRETAREFAVRRLLRIYPPIILTTIVIFILQSFGTPPLTTNPTPLGWILSLTLVNYLIIPQVLVIGVAWTLCIEVLFYLIVWFASPLGKRVPWAFPVVVLVVALVARNFDRNLGDSFFLLAVFTTYLPMLVIGQVTFLAVSRRIPKWMGAVGLVAAWCTFVWCLEPIYPDFLQPASAYGPSVVLAVALFLGAVAAEGRLRPIRALDVVARRSYSLYLIHWPVGYAMVDLLTPIKGLPTTVIILITFAAIAAGTEVAYRLAEKPSVQLGRWIFRKSKAVHPVDPLVAGRVGSGGPFAVDQPLSPHDELKEFKKKAVHLRPRYRNRIRDAMCELCRPNRP
jgi:peptidoglycan/LPS O-acetylase OafA/YrhL